MSFSFDQAHRVFQKGNLRSLYTDSDGLRFLKLQSMARGEYLQRLLNEEIQHVKAPQKEYLEATAHTKGKKQFHAIYESGITDAQIEKAIRRIYKEQRDARKEHEDVLISELYNVRSFDWGGLHPHSLEKTIVNNYVKKIRSFSKLVDKIENEIHQTMRAYVLCSWYEYWTSVIIQDLFTDHPHVLPVLTPMKRIDFFVRDVPFMLNVSHLPEDYIDDFRTAAGYQPEINLLKKEAKSLKIHFDPAREETRLLEDLWIKLKDHPSKSSHTLLTDLREKRVEILDECQKNSDHLARWFYEHQGGRRFDAANRLFLVLVDRENFFNSWTLKRAKPLLVETIHDHLNGLTDPPGTEVSFNWRNEEYTATADVLFAIRNR